MARTASQEFPVLLGLKESRDLLETSVQLEQLVGLEKRERWELLVGLDLRAGRVRRECLTTG